MIDQTTIDELKSRIDIVEVVGDFVTLKRSGQNYKALSPFNNEKTPSFYVVPSKGIFKDFSSGKGGDAITFVMEVDGLSYIEALKYLAKKYGVEVIEEIPDDEYQAAQNERESLFIVLGFAQQYFEDLLWKDDEGRSIGLSYFKERAFSEETIKEFGLGYSLEAWDGLIKAADKKGYKQEYLEKAGLKVVKEGKEYDRFRGRVIFPIHNITGKVVAFGARILKKDKKQPKYLNSPETELYQKSKILYGLYQAKQDIRKEDNCYLVEGYTDVISLHQAGVKNVVSSSGTALTEDQIKLIGRYTKNITVLFDGDAAGIKAATRGIDMILEGGLDVKAIAFPEGEDPDSYAKQLGTSAFRNFLDTEATDFIKFKTSFLVEEASSDPLKKASTIKEIVNSIAKIPDPIKRTVYLKECSGLLDISEAVLVAELNKLLISASRDKKNAPPEQTIPIPEEFQEEEVKEFNIDDLVDAWERESLKMLVNFATTVVKDASEDEQYLIAYFFSETEDVEYKNPVYKKILNLYQERFHEGEIITPEYLLGLDDQEIKSVVIDLITEKYDVSELWWEKYQIAINRQEDEPRDATFLNIARLKFRIIQKMIEDNKKDLEKSEDIESISKFQEKHLKLKQKGMQIAKILGNVTT
ncbi:MAG: DNA primase [bacterium]|nr:DNA primase [bacterium]